MSCWETVQKYAFQSIGYGERVLPRTDITLCDQFTLIGSGMIMNLYFGLLAVSFGFLFANALAMAKFSGGPVTRKAAEWFIFLFRGSPLFIGGAAHGFYVDAQMRRNLGLAHALKIQFSNARLASRRARNITARYQKITRSEKLRDLPSRRSRADHVFVRAL